MSRPRAKKIKLLILDVDGVKLIESAQFVLLPGKARHLDLPGQVVAGQARSTRLQFLPAVQVQPNLPGERRCAEAAPRARSAGTRPTRALIRTNHATIGVVAASNHRARIARRR